jgi:DNA/RNA-binding domain of Phe-tRNA-synthetase-like protein
MMEYRIASAIFSAFPNFRRGVVVARGIDNSQSHSELAAMLNDEAATVSANPDNLLDSRLGAWDCVYQSFGANPRRDTPSIRFLVAQISKGRPPRPINDVVNIFNVISLRFQMPCGGDDLGALDGQDVRLDFAKGHETFAPLFNPEKIEGPMPGEVVYFASPSNRVMCRRWNWRNAHFSRIRLQTTAVAVNLDALIPPLSETDLHEALATTAKLLGRFCGGQISTYVMDHDTPAIEI